MYINKTMDERYPLMVRGIYEDGKLQMVIMLWGLNWEKMTLGRANFLTVVSYLIQNLAFYITGGVPQPVSNPIPWISENITILGASTKRVTLLTPVLTILLVVVLVYLIYLPLSVLIPSSSGLATLSVPVVAPLGQFAGVGGDVVVTAFQSACGLVNLVTPTAAVVMGALALGRIPYEKWLKFVWKLMLLFLLLTGLLLVLAAALS